MVANKELKALINKANMKWRAEFLMAERAKTPNHKFRRIKIKIQVDTMTDIVEELTNAFYDGQSNSRSIKKVFSFTGQDPWVERKNNLKAHIDSLANSNSNKWWKMSWSTAILQSSHELINWKSMRRQLFRYLQPPDRYLRYKYFLRIK